MLHEEIDIYTNKYQIKASVKIPSDTSSRVGIILAHGSIINRQSLLRRTYSFGEYLCEELGAYVIAPDFQGETVHIEELKISNFSEIFNATADFFKDKYNLDTLMGFGHSMGCLVLSQALQNNKNLDSIVNYGGPVKEFTGTRQSSFIDYLVKYVSTYDYSINIKNLFKYIFDKETCRYFDNIMCKDKEYNSSNYNYVFESNIFKEIKQIAYEYTDLIKEWGDPALLLFGTEDGATRKTIKYFADGSTDNNIRVEHIPKASHVTPCMFSKPQLTKFKPAITFYNKVHNITNKRSFENRIQLNY